jgi:hypothetical protein
MATTVGCSCRPSRGPSCSQWCCTASRRNRSLPGMGRRSRRQAKSRRKHRQASRGSGCTTLRDAITSETSRHAKRHEPPLVSRRQACCLLGQSQPHRPVRRLRPGDEARPGAVMTRIVGPLPRCQPPIAASVTGGAHIISGMRRTVGLARSATSSATPVDPAWAIALRAMAKKGGASPSAGRPERVLPDI